MTKPAIIPQFPEEIRAKIDAWLHSHGYADYSGLHTMLEELGYKICRSSLHLYGQGVKKKVARMRESAEMVKHLLDALGGRANDIGLATQAMAQQMIFDFLSENELDMTDVNIEKKNEMIVKVMNALPKLAAGFVAQDKRRDELLKLEQLESDAVSGKRNLDPQTIQVIRQEIFGL